MIKNVTEIQKMLLEQGSLEDDPIFKNPYMMTSPGCSAARLAALKTLFPLLSESYVRLLGLYNFGGIVLGDFSLYPYDFQETDIVSDFTKAQEDSFFPKEFMDKHKLYQIGSFNTDILCITEGTEQFHEGEILYIDEGFDIYNPEDSQIRPIAKDFEQFLIVAGNLEKIHCDMKGDDSLYEEKKTEFLERLKILGVDEKYHPAWLNVF